MSEILTPGGKQSVPIINESGLYSLVLSDASSPLAIPVRTSGTLRTFQSIGISGKTPSKRANYPNYTLSPKYRKYPNYPNQNPRPSHHGKAGALCLIRRGWPIWQGVTPAPPRAGELSGAQRLTERARAQRV